MQPVNPFDSSQQAFQVLVNARRQFSLWPVFASLPAGWQPVFGPAEQAACLVWLNHHWQSLTPADEAKQRHV